jgi:hypothetical protein
MSKGCRPREYMTVTPGGTLTYGWRCKHHPSKRFLDPEKALKALKEHRKETKQK